MALPKPSIPKGTRDFSPVEMARRNYIFDTLRSIFRKYGFAPIETPTMENLSTLMGKYGDEGDKLLFKVLNSGDFLKGVDGQLLTNAAESGNPASLATKICEKGLRYDLTVPFARYIVQHRNELTLPFKRYQIQPVWRADRPQKGRYREFYQCDVDSIGSRSLLTEVELVQIVDEAFRALGIRVLLKINNRKILYGIASAIGHADRMVEITVAIDKLDKIGIEAVEAELAERGLSTDAIAMLRPIISLSGTNREKLAAISKVITCDEGRKGIEEVATILDYIDALGVELPIELDLSLARGLSYYTGAIFEVKALDFAMGSISGGGRYDDLTGIFGLADTSGCGISFGADRIYDVMLGLDLFPKETECSVSALFVNFGGDEQLAALKAMQQLRSQGISCEIYPENEKMKKQFDYATRRAIPYMIFIGESEMANQTATVKKLETGEQVNVPLTDLVTAITK